MTASDEDKATATCCVLWMDTDGQFHLQNFHERNLVEPDDFADAISESGLPVDIVQRSNWLRRLARSKS